MELAHPRAAGIDIGKDKLVVCVRVAGPRRASESVSTYGTVTQELLRLCDDLVAAEVTCAVMESTGDYWKPVYYILEEAGFELIVGNARLIKGIPGRKSDVSDSCWLAQLGAYGLVRSSFVPPPPIRALRDLTRDRSALLRMRARLQVRLQGVLEDAGIKLDSVVSDLKGASARDMLEQLVRGQRDPQVLAELARGRMRSKHQALAQALTGRFTEHHAFRARLLLQQMDQLSAAIQEYSTRIEQEMQPYAGFRDLISTIPGVSATTAEIVTAETGADMAQFPSPKHLASWAGVAPGSNESAGVIRSSKTRKGNNHLKGALGTSAMSIARHKGTYLNTRHWRIAARRGRTKAIVATERALLTAIWHVASTGTAYHELGPDYFTHLDPERATRQALKRLQSLGWEVNLTKATA